MKAVLGAPLGWTRRRWLGAFSGGVALAAAASPAPPTFITWPALVAVDGSHIDAAAWQGVPAVVVFWATYCGFCLRHNAHLDRLYRAVDPARLRILGVALDSDRAGVQAYLRRHGYGFPVVLDGGQLRQRFTPRRVIPMTCSVGSDGSLRQCIPGEMAEGDVMELAHLALPALR